MSERKKITIAKLKNKNYFFFKISSQKTFPHFFLCLSVNDSCMVIKIVIDQLLIKKTDSKLLEN